MEHHDWCERRSATTLLQGMKLNRTLVSSRSAPAKVVQPATSHDLGLALVLCRTWASHNGRGTQLAKRHMALSSPNPSGTACSVGPSSHLRGPPIPRGSPLVHNVVDGTSDSRSSAIALLLDSASCQRHHEDCVQGSCSRADCICGWCGG